MSSSNERPNPSAVISTENPDDLFDLIEEIAAGAFGAVYKGTFKPTGELVAVKIVAVQDEDAYNDLLMEIGIMKRCSHPNVVKFFGAYQQGEELWIAMELCTGSINTLYEVIEEPLGEPEIAWILKETVKGLDYLHNVGIIHRDIKAPNILLNSAGDIKLADFGVSALLTKPDQKRNTFVGTPWWMAPEIIIAARDFSVFYDTKVDIWALGVMCLELAHCRPPLSDLPPMEVLVEIPNRPPPSLNEPEKWSKNYVDFIQKCLVKKVDERKAAKELLQHPFLANPNINRDATIRRIERAEKAIQDFQNQTESDGTLDSKSTKDDDSSDSRESTMDSNSGSAVKQSLNEAEGPLGKKNVKNTYRAKTLKERTNQSERILQERMLQLQLRAMKRQQKEQQKIQEQEKVKRDEALERLVKKYSRSREKLTQQLQETDGTRLKKCQKILEETIERHNKELKDLQRTSKEDFSKAEKKLLKAQKEEMSKVHKSKDKRRKLDEMKLNLTQHIDRLVAENENSKDLIVKTQQLKTTQLEQYQAEVLKQIKEKHGIVLDGFRQLQKLDIENIANESATKMQFFQQYKSLVVSQLRDQLNNEYAQYQKDRTLYSKQKLKEIQDKLLAFEKEDKKKEKLALAKIKLKAEKKKLKEEAAEKRRQRKTEDETRDKQALELGEFQKENQWKQLQLETQRYQEEQLLYKKYELEKEIVHYSLLQQMESFSELHKLRREHNAEVIRLVQQHENQSLKLQADGMTEFRRHMDNVVKNISKLIDTFQWDKSILSAEGLTVDAMSKEFQDRKNKLILQAADSCEEMQLEVDKVSKTIRDKATTLQKALSQEYSEVLQAMLLEKKEILRRVHEQRSGELKKLNEEELKYQDLYHAEQLKLFELKLSDAHQMMNRHHKQQNDNLQFFISNLLFIKHDFSLQKQMKEKLAADQAKMKKDLVEESEVERKFMTKRQDDQKRELKMRIDKESALVSQTNSKEEQQLKDEEITILLEVQTD